jgi:hypothetical protein
MPTCNIVEAACTSGNLQLTLTASENVTLPSDWSIKTANTVFTKNVTSNSTVNVTVIDAA